MQLDYTMQMNGGTGDRPMGVAKTSADKLDTIMFFFFCEILSKNKRDHRIAFTGKKVTASRRLQVRKKFRTPTTRADQLRGANVVRTCGGRWWWLVIK